jgi:hypothetical protein
MAFLDPVGLLIFFAALAAAYGIGRLVRTLRQRWQRSRQPSMPMTRAERRRAERERR